MWRTLPSPLQAAFCGEIGGVARPQLRVPALVGRLRRHPAKLPRRAPFKDESVFNVRPVTRAVRLAVGGLGTVVSDSKGLDCGTAGAICKAASDMAQP